MILKGSQRASGQNLAVHLMRLDDNEHVELHELRGFVARDLKGAFKEAEAISLGTKCKNYLFSLSLNPPESSRASVEDFEKAIGKVERTLDLEGLPRVIVFHEKEGRRHAHVVYSRIDAQTMTARQMPFFKQRLMDVSRELFLDHGWKMPSGMVDASLRDPKRFSLAEWQQAKRTGLDPRLLKQAAQDGWSKSDNASSFERSLEEHGLFLARGDRRSFVVIDHQGEVYALPRLLDVKTGVVRDRLGEADKYRSVEDTRGMIASRMTPAIRQHVDEARKRFQERSAKLGEHKSEMTRLHRAARSSLVARQKLERDSENRDRASRLPKGVRGFLYWVFGKYQAIRRANEREAQTTSLRQAGERRALIDAQRDQRAVLQKHFRELRNKQAQLLLELRSDIGRYLKLATAPETRGINRTRSTGLRLDR